MRCPLVEDLQLASRAELSSFLEGIEKRAFRTALFALRDEELALDAVQDAMLKLCASYAGRPAPELPMLFQRILRNAVYDLLRRRKVRNTWTTLFSALMREGEESEDPLDALPAAGLGSQSPQASLEQHQTLAIIEREIARLPTRQREAFLMRYWEEMDISETAAAMGCSEGSVKTHCSRATKTLAAALRGKGVLL